MRWLISDYYASADFQRLDESTQKTRRNVLERFCLNQNDGDKPYALILPRHIRARRDAMVETPSAANTMLKALRVVFKHALRNDLVTSNPAAVVEMFPSNGEGFPQLDHGGSGANMRPAIRSAPLRGWHWRLPCSRASVAVTSSSLGRPI